MNEMISVDEALLIFKKHGHTIGRTTLFYSIIGQHDTIPNVRGVKIGSRWMTYRGNVEKAAEAWRGFPLFVSAAHKLVADEIDVDLPTFLMWRRTGRYGLVACKWKNRRGVLIMFGAQTQRVRLRPWHCLPMAGIGRTYDPLATPHRHNDARAAKRGNGR